jgi:hypothetical protein
VNPPNDADARPAGRPPQASSHGPEGEALVVEVRAALETLARLLDHEELFSEQVVSSIRSAMADAESRLAREELRVVVVGEPGSGKSTLLDALIGERLLGTKKTDAPITLRSAPELDYRARLAGGALERFSARAPGESAPMRRELVGLENALAEAGRRQTDALRELTAAGAALEVVEDELDQVSRELDGFRQEAERAIAVSSTLDDDHVDLEAAAHRAEHALPAWARHRPAWWAIWLWFAWLFVAPFLWRRMRERRQLVQALERRSTERSQAHAARDGAEERLRVLERARSEAVVPVERAGVRRDAAQAQVDANEARATELRKRRERLEKDLARLEAERKNRFLAELAKLFDGASQGRLVELEIDYPARVLPADIAMIDAPGAFSSDAAAERRFWKLLEEQADACIVASELDRAVSGKTRAVLQRLKGSVGHAILVLTKLDQAVRTALRQGSRELSETVEQARRIATRRFAREVGRDPDTVLSVAVAARDALEHSEETYAGFEREASKLFQLLWQERALILGSRCAQVVRRCIAAAAETERQAEQAYVDRIGTLEAERRPEPGDLRLELVRSSEPELDVIAGGVVVAAVQAVDDGVRLLRMECESLILGCRSKAELRGLGPRLSVAINVGFERAREEISGVASRRADVAIEPVERKAYELARKHYDLLPAITRSPGSTIRIELALDPPRITDEPEQRIARVFHGVERMRFSLLAGGIVLGLALGTLAMPGVGSVVGALFGSLANFALTLGTLKKRSRKAIEELVSLSKVSLVRGIEASRPTIAACLSVFLNELIDRALSRFGRWIAEPLEAERRAIQDERDKLEDLQRLVTRLEAHDHALETLSQVAARASLGICR